MARDVARASLYAAPINLWVEDEVTRAYLDAVWNNPSIRFLIGGGSEGVQAIVSDAQKAGHANVFAVIDRDFRHTNKANWSDPAKSPRRYILPVHEIENYLLDSVALEGCRLNNLKKAAVQIESMMEARAHDLCWWAACRDVVAEIRRRFRDDFLTDPPCSVSTEPQAQGHICKSPWFEKLSHEATRTTEEDIHQLLADAHTRANQAISNGQWRTEFAGKEILRDVGSRICDQTKIRGYAGKPSQFHEDLAKEVGAWQRENNAVPKDLTDLVDALQQRIARSRPGKMPGS
ncbi:MAG: hypothetical protein ACYC61_11475 [Isosphaeraceae bacterium]